MPLAASTGHDTKDGDSPAGCDQTPRERKRRRRFAWQSSSDVSAASSSDEVDRSSSASSSSSALWDCTVKEPVIWHSTIGDAEYLKLRENAESNAARAYKGAGTAPPVLRGRPPPLGKRIVARRRRRLSEIRASLKFQTTPGDELWPGPALDLLAAQLRGRGFAVVDNLLGSGIVDELLRGVAGLKMSRGHLGDDGTESRSLRGDFIAWPEVDSSSFGHALQEWQVCVCSCVVALRPRLSRCGELANVAGREPTLASCYPPGACYIRHYDNNCEDGTNGDCSGRRLTAVYYLNDVAADDCGCHLRLATNRGTYDVLPSADTLVLFWADRRTPHEVLPNRSQKPRYALSNWFVDVVEAPAARVIPLLRHCCSRD